MINMVNHRERNINLAKNFMDCCWNDKDLNSLTEFMGKETIIQSPVKFSIGHQSFRNVMDVWLRAFPNIQYKQTEIAVHDSCIELEWEVNGTHLGDFFSISPTGKSITYKGITKLSFTNGRLLHYGADVDVKKIMNQLVDYGLRHTTEQTSQNVYGIVNDLLGINLTNRQIECIALSMLHMSSKEIASTLSIAYSSVQTHLKRAYEALGVSNRKMLVDYAINQHLVEFLIRIGLFLRKK